MITFLVTIICLIPIIVAGLAAIALVLDYLGIFEKKSENKDQTTIIINIMRSKEKEGKEN